ncbi:MAG: hypothetical protein ACRD9Q_08515 [Nitrososphaeraceae archaeon]
MIDITSLAYIAGIVDGEGYVGICKNKSKKRKNENTQYIETVSIGMNKPHAISLINEIFGGKIREEKYIKNRITFTNKSAMNFLRNIFPYLRVKSGNARILFELEKDKYDNIGHQRISDTRIEFREYLYRKVKALNHNYGVIE